MAHARPKYYHEEPELSEKVEGLFRVYVGLPQDQIVQHIKQVRDKAWALFPYPCIGAFSFLELTTQDDPIASDVIVRMKSGNQTLLDLGCCFAQDIRHLVFEGALSENMTGFELKREFVDLGYELFRDRETLKSDFIVGDFFDEACGLKEGSFDIIHASAFFHLFNWEEQVEGVSKAVRLLKPKTDSLIFGRQAGAEVADSYPHSSSRSGEMYRHDQQSFKRLVGEVGRRTGTQLVPESKLGPATEEDAQKEGFRLFTFSIRMTGGPS